MIPRVVVVEPIYQINLGYMARVSKNFGVKRLNLVNPRCKYNGKEAVKYSKHARELLENARVFKTLDSAVGGTFVLGTTAIWRKTGGAFFNVYSLGGFMKLAKKNKIKNISVLIGRDNIGLTKEELAKCDATVFIPTSDEYPALNISHALGILLYAFSSMNGHDQVANSSASREEVERVKFLFTKLIAKRKDIRDKKAVAMSFGHILKRSGPTKKEVSALSVALSPKYNR